MVRINDFLKKNCPKNAHFGVHDSLSPHFGWRGLALTILKIMTFSTGVLKNTGHKLSDELWADLLGSKLSDWQPLEFFL